MRELQSLGGVYGHELHLVVAAVRIAVGEQGYVGEVVLQGTFLSAAYLVFVNGLLQLRQVVQPLLAARGAQRRLIAAFVEYGG